MAIAARTSSCPRPTGLGARRSCTTRGTAPSRTVRNRPGITAGGSFGGNSLTSTIGLGQARTITALEVYWPTSGLRQRFEDVPIDRMIEITEGQDAIQAIALTPIALP